MASVTDALLAHSATKLDGAAGRVVVCGSHGGRYAGLLAIAAGVRAILLNDAGVGRDEAGIAGIRACEEAGVAAAALDHMSCRIGNADDALARGRVSFAGALANRLGVEEGLSAREAARLLASASRAAATTVKGEEHRSVITLGTMRLVVVDSAALVRHGEDDGAIVITGSHGGLVGDDPATAGRAEAALIAFNDAGVGADRAGVSRLPVLDARGVAGVCVSCASARIGEGRSTLSDGIVSHANAAAARLGAHDGEPLRDLVERLAGAALNGLR